MNRHPRDTPTTAECSSPAVSSTSSSCSPVTIFRSFFSGFFSNAAPHYRVTQRTECSNGPSRSLPRQRPEPEPCSSNICTAPSHDTSSRTVPCPSLYSYNVASQRRRTVIIDKFQAVVERVGAVRRRRRRTAAYRMRRPTGLVRSMHGAFRYRS